MSPPTPPSTDPGAPTVWALLGSKTGDNAQVIALVQALGRPYRMVRLRYKASYRLPNRLLGATLRTVAAAEPDLQPPWPDLVVAAGRRSVPVARWIQGMAGGRVRLVQIGRPRAPLGWFDLILAPPQYRLPARANVIPLSLPVVPTPPSGAPDPDWQAAIDALPRPRAAVLIGGPARSVDLPPATVRRTLAVAAERVGARGALMITTSPRTPEAHLPTLPAGRSTLVYRWHAPGGQDNPIAAFLDAADRIVVTGDSVSLLAQAVATGKPVTVVPAPKRGLYRWLAAGRADLLRRWQRALANAPVLTPPPDPDAVLSALVAEGRAVWRDGVLEAPGGGAAPGALVEDAVARIAALLEDGRG